MAKPNFPIYSFNKGMIGRHALGRLDAESMQLAAEEQTNWLPMALGPMQMRPGLKYIGSTRHGGDNQASEFPAIIRPFVFATNDTALIEHTTSVIRYWVDDELVTINNVSTTVADGDFGSSAGWTLVASSGATASIANGDLILDIEAVGSTATCEQAVSVSDTDKNTKHRLKVTVNSGPVGFSVGTTSGGDDIFPRAELDTGVHSLAFTPGVTTIYLRFFALTKFEVFVTEARFENTTPDSGGDDAFFNFSPYENNEDLPFLQQVQSGDQVFVANPAYHPRIIERRENNSWSLVYFRNIGGPYQEKPRWALNVGMKAAAHDGGTATLESTSAFFKSTDIQTNIAVQTEGVAMKQLLGALGATSEAFQVIGVATADRDFAYQITGTFTATIALERSTVGADTGFVEVQTFSGTTSSTFSDAATHTNQIVWYRFRITAYTSGNAGVSITYGGGPGARAQARIGFFTNSTQVQVAPYDYFESTTYYSKEFRISDWSPDIGWPSAVAIHDGRLFWGGRDKIWGSISDDFTNFEETFEGEAGPINRSFGYGPYANVNWILSLERLIVGRDSSCESIRSSSFDAPLTPTDFTVRNCTQHGSAAGLSAVHLGTSGVYVDKSGRRVYELRYNVDAQDYTTRDLTLLNPDIGIEGFVDIAVQHQPDTRIHVVRGDGKVAVLSYERDQVEAWWLIETDGAIESVAVLPGEQEDSVYYVVKRQVKEVTPQGEVLVYRRYIEKLAMQSECVGGEMNKIADSFIEYTGVPTTTITGLAHLEGKEVVVWGNGKDLGKYPVSGGQIAGLSEAVESAVVGLEYEARFKSTKLGIGAVRGSALTQKKRIETLGLVLADTHHQGLEYGQDFDDMDNLPQVEGGTVTPANTIWTEFDTPMVPVPGSWSTDSRLCLRATAPRPATVLAAVIGVSTHEKP
jgi:hypothetical protein